MNPLVSVHFSAERRARQPPPPRPPPSHPPCGCARSDLAPTPPPSACSARHRVVDCVLAAGDGEDTGRILRDARLSVSDLLAGEPARRMASPAAAQLLTRPASRVRPGDVDLGSLGLGGGAYVLDIVGTRVGPRGFARPVLFVFPDADSRERFARALGRSTRVRVRGRRRRRRTLQRYRPDRLARSPSARGGGFWGFPQGKPLLLRLKANRKLSVPARGSDEG